MIVSEFNVVFCFYWKEIVLMMIGEDFLDVDVISCLVIVIM